jgi:hypothetical protein
MPTPTSISQRIGAAPLSSAEARELLAILQSMQADTQAIATQFNQLRADYNANATIATDTTATAITLNTTA